MLFISNENNNKYEQQLSLNMNYSLSDRHSMSKSKEMENENENEIEKEKKIHSATTFRDDFHFRMELTAGFVALCVVLLYQMYVYNRHPLSNTEDWEFGLILQLFGSLMASILGVFIQIVVPYFTLQSNIKNFGDPTAVKRYKSEQSVVVLHIMLFLCWIYLLINMHFSY